VNGGLARVVFVYSESEWVGEFGFRFTRFSLFLPVSSLQEPVFMDYRTPGFAFFLLLLFLSEICFGEFGLVPSLFLRNSSYDAIAMARPFIRSRP